MNAEPIHYSKLPGPSLGWAGRTRLWLAGDHVLEMNWTIFAERYHRYFLHDIRGVIAQRTRTGRMWNIALGSLAAASIALAGAAFWIIERINGSDKVTNGDVTAVWVLSGMFGAVALFFIALLIFNTLLGPTCRFYIQTTAGTKLLAAPTRLRRAQRLLARLGAHIESAQSAAVPEPAALL